MKPKAVQVTPEQEEALRRQLASGVDPRSIVVRRTKAGREAGEPNKGEAAYGRMLERLQQEKVVKWFGFEKVKFRIGKKCWLTVDYVVMFWDGRIELIDVKGRKGDRYYCREDSKVKLRAATSLFPFKVAIVWPLKGSGWGKEYL